MPPRKNSTRSATLASLMAAGVSAPTLAFAEDGLGLTAEPTIWAPARLSVVPGGARPGATATPAAPPPLRVLADLEET